MVYVCNVELIALMRRKLSFFHQSLFTQFTTVCLLEWLYSGWQQSPFFYMQYGIIGETYSIFTFLFPPPINSCLFFWVGRATWPAEVTSNREHVGNGVAPASSSSHYCPFKKMGRCLQVLWCIFYIFRDNDLHEGTTILKS